MTAPTDLPDGLGARIRAQRAHLGPQELRAAEFMHGHLDELALYNAAEVARLSGVSKATLSRLYRKLGFRSADEVRAHLRSLRASGTPVALGGPGADDQHLLRELSNLRAALTRHPEAIADAAQLVAGARRVVVVGFRNSYPVALHLRTQLAFARPSVALAPQPGQSVAEEVATLTERDVVVLVGFRRRPAGFGALLAALCAAPVRVVLLADSGVPADGVDVVLRCPVESVGPFDSYAAAASVVSRLAAAVLDARPDGAHRVEAISATQRALAELADTP